MEVWRELRHRCLRERRWVVALLAGLVLLTGLTGTERAFAAFAGMATMPVVSTASATPSSVSTVSAPGPSTAHEGHHCHEAADAADAAPAEGADADCSGPTCAGLCLALVTVPPAWRAPHADLPAAPTTARGVLGEARAPEVPPPIG